MDSKERSDMDQAFAAMNELAENLPISWGIMFNRCLKEGFTTDQSIKLVQTYIISQNPHGVNFES